MAFREVRVYEMKEVLRLWLRGEGQRSVERLVGVDRMTVRRYVAAAVGAGLDRNADEGQSDDAFMAKVCERARPRRPDGHGASWATPAEVFWRQLRLSRSRKKSRPPGPRGCSKPSQHAPAT
jgi:hypothetical protein